MTDVSGLAGETEFRVFQSTIESGGIVKGFAVPGCGSYTQSETRQLEQTAKDSGAAGLAHVRLRGSGDLTSLTDEDVVLSSGLRMPLEWSVRMATQMGAKRIGHLDVRYEAFLVEECARPAERLVDHLIA